MAKNFIQPGNVITFTASANVASGSVVRIGQLLGVALADVANGKQGEAQITGVFRLPKVTTAVIPAGASLLWDASAGKFDANSATAASGDVLGAAVAVEAAGNGAADLAVRLTGTPGVLTP